MSTKYETIKPVVEGRVLTIQLNRPEVLNALNTQMMMEILDCASSHDANPDIGCLVLKGNEHAFAAGADIAELAVQDYASMAQSGFFAPWDQFAKLRTPKLAMVSGYALGGGCELAMMCDVIIAAQSAQFGQPEIKIGCIPGIGGTQRLTRLVGRANAMDMILTGRMIDADEALAIGLVSRVVATDQAEEAVAEIAQKIANYPKDIALMARSCVHQAEEVGLSAGMNYERQTYHSLFGLPAQREGMQAFMEKREPRFR